MDFIIDLIKQAFAWLKNIAQYIIRGILSFARHIVDRFKSLNLNPQKDIPFVLNGNKQEFKKMLREARVIDEGIFSTNTQIVSGVYDQSTDEITHAEILGADGLDQKTKDTLGDDSIIVLS